VARLRVLSHVVPDPRGLERLTIDLAGQEYGGIVVASSDDFYNSACLLNRPDTARSMGEGWETRRRRDAGHDHAVIRLAFAGQVHRLIVDTAHFKYNASAEIAAYGMDDEAGGMDEEAGGMDEEAGGMDEEAGGSAGSPAPAGPAAWKALLPRTRLQPDTRHVLAVGHPAPIVLLRLDAFPDGGLSRVRVIGSLDPAARSRAGYRWFNSLPQDQAVRCLAGTGLEPGLAADVSGQRPLTGAWLAGPGRRLPAAAFNALATMLAGHAAP